MIILIRIRLYEKKTADYNKNKKKLLKMWKTHPYRAIRSYHFRNKNTIEILHLTENLLHTEKYSSKLKPKWAVEFLSVLVNLSPTKLLIFISSCKYFTNQAVEFLSVVNISSTDSKKLTLAGVKT